MSTLQVNTGASVSWDYQVPDATRLTTGVNRSGLSNAQQYLSTATGATKCTKKYEILLTVGLGTQSVNFQSLVDGFGNALNFSIVRVLYLECTVGSGTVSFVSSGFAPATICAKIFPTPADITPVITLEAGDKRLFEVTTAAGMDSTDTILAFDYVSGITFTVKLFIAGE